MNKASGADPEPAGELSRPRQVTLAAGALMLSGVAAVVAALSLYGLRDWLVREQTKANKKAIDTAGTDAVTKAKSKHETLNQIAQAKASARAKTRHDLGSLDHQISQQQSGALIGAVLVLAVVIFLSYGVLRGRHWSRWAVSGFWVLSSFTSTLVGFTYVFAVASSLPGLLKGATFIASVSLIAAVVLVNLRPSTAYFAAHRPVPTPGAAPRRGLFAPRPPRAPRTPGQSPKPGVGSVLTSSAASRGESYVERQRSKKRAAANAESVARGAELARSRAKASKSRRIEPGR